MEISLALQGGVTVSVICDGQPSHTFDLASLPVLKKPGEAPRDPASYGQGLYAALFPARSLAARMLASELKQADGKKRLLLVTASTSLDAVLWEYTWGPDGCLASAVPFVRGLPDSERKPVPTLGALRVAGITANPSGKDAAGKALESVETEPVWQALEGVFNNRTDASVERAVPATLDELRHRLSGQKQRVVHFSGPAGIFEGQAALYFEKEGGSAAPIKGRDLVNRLGDTLFMVVMATPQKTGTGKPLLTDLGSLAAGLAKWGLPYAIGLRYRLNDSDMQLLIQTLYGDLAHGVPVEQAVWRLRQRMQQEGSPWLAGAVVLCTSLSAASGGFTAGEAPAPVPPEAAAEATPKPQAATEEVLQPDEIIPAPFAEKAGVVNAPGEGGERQKVVVHLSGEQVQAIASNTVAVLTQASEHRGEWRNAINNNYQQVKQMGFQPEIEFFGAILTLLDGVQPVISPDSPYAMVMKTIQDVLSEDIKPPEPKEVELPKESNTAVAELLKAHSPKELRRVIEKRKAQLFRPEVDEFLVSLAQEAQAESNTEAVQVLVVYTNILRQCQQIGIEAAFAQLEQAALAAQAEDQADAGEAVDLSGTPEMPLAEEAPLNPIPDDFVARCIEGLHGGRPEREALFNYLEVLPIPDAGFSALLKTVKLALLGSKPGKLGQDLSGAYAEAWQQVVSGLA